MTNAASIVPVVPPGFWPQIDHQLNRIRIEKPDTFNDVRGILLDPIYGEIVLETHRNGPRSFDLDTGFFAGSGGDRTLHDALNSARWHIRTYRTSYHYVLVNERTGEVLTYTEGDVQRGDLVGGN